jgi:hypothetical protein
VVRKMGIGISVGVKGIARAYTQRHTHRDTDTHIQFALNKKIPAAVWRQGHSARIHTHTERERERERERETYNPR